MRNQINDEYFEWLSELVYGERQFSRENFGKLLVHLHNTDFRYSIAMDQNRAEDGIDLRYRFALDLGYEGRTEVITDDLEGPCSMLEMMVALATRCEENIMDDPRYGNRTGQWFWSMVTSLGLGCMTNERFDEAYVEECLERFFNHDYDFDGRGGLFTVRDCKCDMRDVEIWRQLCWYVDSIV